LNAFPSDEEKKTPVWKNHSSVRALMNSGKGIGEENQRYPEEEMRPYSQNFNTPVVITRWY